MSLLKIKDANGNWQDIPAIKGKDGEVTLEQLKSITGELEDLSTEDKSNLVNAINEILEGGKGFTLIDETSFDPLEQETGIYILGKNVMSIKSLITTSPGNLTGSMFVIYNNDPVKAYISIFNFNYEPKLYYYSKRSSGVEYKRSVNLFNMVYESTAQTISGVKTFSKLPESSVTPTTDNQFVNKAYVDDAITSAITTVLEGEY